jgi:hypothetical protein
MLNAAAALGRSVYPLASMTTSTDKASIGESVTLDGSASTAAANYTIAAYQWTSDPAVSIENDTSAVAKLVFPALRPLKVTLKVTDSAGRTDTATKTINSVALSEGGGKGAMSPTGLLLLGTGAALAFWRRKQAAAAMLGGSLVHPILPVGYRGESI